MGQVFTARDTRLGRAVAIKISNATFSDRLEREARSISALNHPNICQLRSTTSVRITSCGHKYGAEPRIRSISLETDEIQLAVIGSTHFAMR